MMRKAAEYYFASTALGCRCDSSTTALFAAVAARTLPGRASKSSCSGQHAAASNLETHVYHTVQGGEHALLLQYPAISHPPMPQSNIQQQYQQVSYAAANGPAKRLHRDLHCVVQNVPCMKSIAQQQLQHSWHTPTLPKHHLPYSQPQQRLQLRYYATRTHDKEAVEAAAAAARPEAVSHMWSHSEIISGLQQMGLEPAAALAVLKAWQAGLQIHVSRTPSIEQQKLVKYRHQQSPLRLLARVRRLVRAHQAAAAAAEGAAAAGAGLPDGAATAPSWGQLDISSLLMRHPNLLMLPPKHLQTNFSTLLQGLSDALSSSSALSYVATSPELPALLARPKRLGNNLVALHDTYLRVVGVPPKPRVLENAQSSYMRFRSDTLEQKLKEYVNRFGQHTTHALISSQPHVLSSSTHTVADSCQLIADLLDIKSQDVHTVVQKAPRLLTFSGKMIRSNAARLKHQLAVVGLNARQIESTMRKCPLLLAQSPVTISAKIQGLRELLGDSGQQLAYLIRSQPTVLLHSLQSMHSKMDELEGLLQMDRQQLCYTVSRVPALLQLAPESIAVKLTKSAQVLGLDLLSLLLMVRKEPSIICMTPASMERKLQHICSTMGWDKRDVVQALQANPRALAYDVMLLTDYLSLIQRLATHSSLWLHGGCSGPRASSRNKQQQQQQQSDGTMQDDNATPSSSSSSSSRRKNAWSIAFAKSISERLPLRMEYLASIGLQEKVPLVTVFKTSAAVFEQQYPDFNSWAELRLQSLRLDSSYWSPGLVNKAGAAVKEQRVPVPLPWSKMKAQRALQQQQHLAEQVQQQQLSGQRQQQQQRRPRPRGIAAAQLHAVELSPLQQAEERVTATAAAAVVALERQQAGSALNASRSAASSTAAAVAAPTAAVRRRRRKQATAVDCVEASVVPTVADVPMHDFVKNQQQQQQQDGTQLTLQLESASALHQQHSAQSQYAGMVTSYPQQQQQQQLLYDMPGLLYSAGAVAWYSVPAQQQQQQYQQQCNLADTLVAAAAPGWQLQQQQQQQGSLFEHPALQDYSSSGNVYVDGLLPGLVALQETGYWVAAKFCNSSSSSSRCEQLLSLSELLKQRSRQLAVAGSDWRATAACSG